MIATLMFMINGIAAILVKKPISISNQNTISTVPTKGAKNSGDGIPILINLPTPS